MRLSLSDGYTLPFATKAEVVDSLDRVIASGLPIVTGTYRPAMPEALAEWRTKIQRANGGKEQVAASVEHLAAHLVTWDVILDGDENKPAPIKADFLKLVPEPVLDQLLGVVNTWAAREKAAAAGN